MFDPEYEDKILKSQWVEDDPASFESGGFGYKLKDGAPEDFVKEFEEYKTQFLEAHEGLLGEFDD